MSDFDAPDAADVDPASRPDPRERPVDPAGTKPRHDPDALLPAARESLLTPRADVDSDAFEDDGDLLPEKVVPGGAPAPAALPAAEAPHAARFQFVYGVLIGVGIAALAAAALVFSRGDQQPAGVLSNWSTWHPTKDAGDPIAQIASHVSPEYRLPSGKQIVAVTGGPAQIQGVPLVVALRADPEKDGDTSILEGQNVVLYRMCGLGPECAIAEGKPSKARGLYLNRESLELALYTFSYISDVDAVTVLLPPVKGQQPKHAVFFRQGDLAPVLDRPLGAILPGPTPTLKNLTRAPNTSIVNRLTAPLQFDFSVTPDNTNNRGYLVLDTPS